MTTDYFASMSATDRAFAYLPKDAYSRAAALFIGVTFAYTACLAVYRLVLSPVAGFPGPKIAAVTGWYEFYYDFFLKGTYLYEIEKMHDHYGPIVRINPFELSIRDPEYYDQVYVAGSVRPTDNYHTFARGVAFDDSHFLSTSHELHRKRRKPLEPFFSRLGISKFESWIGEAVGKLMHRFEALEGTGQVIRLDHAFVAFSGDVITSLCTDQPRYLLDEPNFSAEWFELFHDIIKSLPLFMGLPWLIRIVNLIPESVLLIVDPRSQRFNHFKSMAEEYIDRMKREKEQMGYKDTSESGKPTVFRQLVNSDLPQSELTTSRLSREAQVLLGAGTVSTARTLDFITYYILSRPEIQKRLREELKDVMANYPTEKPTWYQLEKLPYLQALIREGLRLSYGIMHRLPRVAPKHSLQFQDWSIPPGVPVAMSAYLQHSDPNIYPSPNEFIPERWLSNVTPAMNRNYVPFSKGSRNCLGMNLAYAELNLMLAALFRPGGPRMELFETEESDLVQKHDLLIPLPKLESKGFRVKFT